MKYFMLLFLLMFTGCYTHFYHVRVVDNGNYVYTEPVNVVYSFGLTFDYYDPYWDWDYAYWHNSYWHNSYYPYWYYPHYYPRHYWHRNYYPYIFLSFRSMQQKKILKFI